MAARVESQAGGTDDEATPSIPSAFKNDHMLGATEAIMWIACRRRFSHETIREHLERHRDRGQWRYGRSQLSRPLQRRAEKAERQLIGLIIGGVPAIGTLDHEGHPDHHERVPVPVEFLKDGAYIELLSGHIRADPLLDKHSGYQRPTYRDVDIDRDAFFKALAAAEPRSQATDRGNEQETCPASTRRRAVLPCGPLAEVQLDFWTPEQIANFIKTKDAFEEFCEADPDLSDLDSTRPDPKCDPEDFEKWYARYCPIHDIAAKRFAGLFREKVLVGMGLEPHDDKEIVLPPEYWAITEDVSTDSEVDHAPHEGEGFASLMVMKKMVQAISPNVPRHLEYYHVLRREDWEKWINDNMPGTQHGPQEPAGESVDFLILDPGGAPDPIAEETALFELEDLMPDAQAPQSGATGQKAPLKERAKEWANRLEPAKNKKGGRRAVAKVIASETGLDHLYIEREARRVARARKRGSGDK